MLPVRAAAAFPTLLARAAVVAALPTLPVKVAAAALPMLPVKAAAVPPTEVQAHVPRRAMVADRRAADGQEDNMAVQGEAAQVHHSVARTNGA